MPCRGGGGKEGGREGGRKREGGRGREGGRVDRKEEEEEKELLTIIPYNNSPVVPSF